MSAAGAKAQRPEEWALGLQLCHAGHLVHTMRSKGGLLESTCYRANVVSMGVGHIREGEESRQSSVSRYVIAQTGERAL